MLAHKPGRTTASARSRWLAAIAALFAMLAGSVYVFWFPGRMYRHGNRVDSSQLIDASLPIQIERLSERSTKVECFRFMPATDCHSRIVHAVLREDWIVLISTQSAATIAEYEVEESNGARSFGWLPVHEPTEDTLFIKQFRDDGLHTLQATRKGRLAASTTLLFPDGSSCALRGVDLFDEITSTLSDECDPSTFR